MYLINYKFLFKIILFNLFIFNLFSQEINKNGENDEIKQKLPGQDFEINFKHYSGFLQVSKTKYFHYILTKSQNNPEKDPLILWLNGGPGCSSLLGLFSELGPYLISENGSKLLENPYSWNKNASILFIESPSGVGYSYSTDNNITTNDDETAKYNYEALKQFFNKFTYFKEHPFYISGESYGGIYLPMLANLIINEQNKFKINFKGMLIGNGALSDQLNINTLPLFAYNHGTVDEQLWRRFSRLCCNNCVDTCNIYVYANQINTTCFNLASLIFQSIYSGLFNPYDIYRNCEGSITKGLTKNKLLGLFSRAPFMTKKMEQFLLLNENKLENFEIQSDEYNYDKPIIPCIAEKPFHDYMNLPKLREALNIPSNLNINWQNCNDNFKTEYESQYVDMIKFIKNILKAKIPVVLYYGDTDSICNFLIGERFVEQLGIKLINPKQAWIFEDQVGGFVTKYEGLYLLTVRGVGHMVPQWAPERAEYIFNQFLNNKSF
ncbi:Carboxypeptidase [Meloidogyne graminicola]|uniref:Carboxypeptidase n=1 Tax=Meloidogyne graminicola TaxID=189291 RepID=A0A8S9ZS17_9BILA|nr:Carboxypeptidase [Meloidogyne graminicola]